MSTQEKLFYQGLITGWLVRTRESFESETGQQIDDVLKVFNRGCLICGEELTFVNPNDLCKSCRHDEIHCSLKLQKEMTDAQRD